GEQRHGVLAAEEHAAGIDRHHPPPFRKGRLFHVTGCANAGIVDETVEPSVVLRDPCHGLAPVRLARHIEAKVGLAAPSKVAADRHSAGSCDGLAGGCAKRAERSSDEHDVVLKLQMHNASSGSGLRQKVSFGSAALPSERCNMPMSS